MKQLFVLWQTWEQFWLFTGSLFLACKQEKSFSLHFEFASKA